MIAEQINDEIILHIPSSLNREDLQRLIDLIRLKEATARSTADQEDINRIAQESKQGWWAANRNRFIHE
jgi:hypothetical protein